MRRREEQITDRAQIDAIIRGSQVCRLALSDQGQPYVVPLCFGYDGKALYFHCAPEGRKLDILRRNNKVSFEFDIVEGMIEADQGCKWGIRYQSVIGSGIAHFVEDPAGKQHALALVMGQYSSGTFSFAPETVGRSAVIRIEIERLTGKRNEP